jgi:protein-tyrosine phosphatase
MTAREVRHGVFIGNESDAVHRGDQFEHVISLTQAPNDETTQHVPLYDGPQTSQDDFDRAVQATIKAIDTHDGSVLVHCQAGISRSSCVLITTLAYLDDSTFDVAYNEVKDAKQAIAPHPYLRELALDFLDEDGSPYVNPFGGE